MREPFAEYAVNRTGIPVVSSGLISSGNSRLITRTNSFQASF